jgi:hypothetical protein
VSFFEAPPPIDPPPFEPVEHMVEWPSAGIDDTRQEVESQPLLDAGRASERLWPDDGGSGGSAQSSLSFKR